MLNRRMAGFAAFAVVFLLGITLGMAQRRMMESGSGDFINNWTYIVTKPFLSVTGFVSSKVRNTTHVFRTYSSLKRENTRLRGEIAGARLLAIESLEDRSEAARLRRLLDLKKSLPESTIAARVLIRPATPEDDKCTIDKGKAHGIQMNAAVLSPDGLIGRVIRVYDSTSLVMLLRDRANSVSAYVQGSRAPGIVKGQGAEQYTMEFIPMKYNIQRRDAVISSGEGGVFPKGLLIGYIQSVESSPHNHFKSALVRPAAEMRMVEEVLVVTR